MGQQQQQQSLVERVSALEEFKKFMLSEITLTKKGIKITKYRSGTAAVRIPKEVCEKYGLYGRDCVFPPLLIPNEAAFRALSSDITYPALVFNLKDEWKESHRIEFAKQIR